MEELLGSLNSELTEHLIVMHYVLCVMLHYPGMFQFGFILSNFSCNYCREVIPWLCGLAQPKFSIKAHTSSVSC